jgi:small-conductance mechanosensitive channel
MLLFEQHIQVGDRITVGDTEGDVTEINIRSTTIRSLNNVAIVVPNSEFISSTVTNWSHGDPKTRLEIEVGVSYSSDMDTVMHSLLVAAKEHPRILSHPEPQARLMSFGDSAWNRRLLAWVGDPQGRRQIQSDINCAIVNNSGKMGSKFFFLNGIFMFEDLCLFLFPRWRLRDLSPQQGNSYGYYSDLRSHKRMATLLRGLSLSRLS